MKLMLSLLSGTQAGSWSCLPGMTSLRSGTSLMNWLSDISQVKKSPTEFLYR